MSYREHPPSAALAPFVACFWETSASANAHRVLPDGAMDVLIAAGGRARVIGPMTQALVTPGSPSWVVGVRFRPGAAITLLGVAARELTDGVADARDVWGRRGRTFDARVGAAAGARAVETLRAARGELPIAAVAARVGLGERQLERIFLERVGYGPKVFARVMRMQRAVDSIGRDGRGSVASWARFAVECGYGDQAHLIREFRALTGVTPATYAAERAMSEIDNPPRTPVATFLP